MTSPVASLDALARLAEAASAYGGGADLIRFGGRVTALATDHVQVGGMCDRARLGSYVETDDGSLGQITSITSSGVMVSSTGSIRRAAIGAAVWLREELALRPDSSWRGRVINALGAPIDEAGPLPLGAIRYPIDRAPLPPLQLARVERAVRTGVRAIDLFTPICLGQRIGIFAGSGVGKTTLLSMLMRTADFDTIVLALVAERGREVREFLEVSLGEQRTRTVTVVATSADDPMIRKISAKTAVTVAEFFRDRGENVLLIVDSLTRFAHAARELALSAGEPPVARGYAPSVFTELPALLERCGPGLVGSGSITGIFSVLVDGDDHNDPVADTIRSILDGHIVLDRAIAYEGRLPAINVLASISRLADRVWTADEDKLVSKLRGLIARFEDTRDLRAAGAYQQGTDAELDDAIAIVPKIYGVLSQSPSEPPSVNTFQELLAALKADAAAKGSGQP